MKNWVDFKKVKEAVSMEMVLSLSRYSIELRRVNATYLRGGRVRSRHTTQKGVKTALELVPIKMRGRVMQSHVLKLVVVVRVVTS